jgi:hypothetical protein
MEILNNRIVVHLLYARIKRLHQLKKRPELRAFAKAVEVALH